jgi:hypothetical protein
MSGYAILNKDNTISPVHNLATGVYLVNNTEAISVIDLYSGRVIRQK